VNLTLQFPQQYQLALLLFLITSLNLIFNVVERIVKARPGVSLKSGDFADSAPLAIQLGKMVTSFFATITITVLLSPVISGFTAKERIIFVAALLILSVVFWGLRQILLDIVISKARGRIALTIKAPLKFYLRLCLPITSLLIWVSNSNKNKDNEVEQHRLLAFVDEQEEADLEDDERAMIHSIIEFGETQVHEIMIPRTDMVTIDENIKYNDLLELMKEKGHSRVPLFSEDIDHIVGIVHIKDLLTCTELKEKSKINLKELAREAYYVPETKRLDDLLRAFQQEKHHMAIVVDEYGGTAGLVTLEDVLEEIVGDIQDEYDQELPLIKKIDDHNFVIDAKIDLHELNETPQIELPTDGEFESLGGFILSLTGYVPSEKEEVTYENYKFFIEKVERNRIITVKVNLAQSEPDKTGKNKPENGQNGNQN